MNVTALHKNGDRRTTPIGGAQVYMDGRWMDAERLPASRVHEAPDPEDEPSPLPSNVEAEQALLGCILLTPEAALDVEGITRPEHFFEGLHGRLYAALRARALKGQGTAPALIASRFAEDEAFQELDGVSYLGLLIERAPPPASARDYAREIAAVFTQRQLMRVGAEVAALGRSPPTDDPDELLGQAERLVAEAGQTTGSGERWIKAGEMVRGAIEFARTRDHGIAYSFGVDALDQHVGGLNAGEVTLLAARPGMGKTVAAQTVARANAAAGLGVPFFSLEMAQNPLGLRLACDLAFDRHAPRHMGVTSNPTADRAMKRDLSGAEWEKLDAAAALVEQWPLFVDTRPGLTLAQIEAAARRAYRQWDRQGIKPGPLVIDHLGKVRPSVDRKGSRHAETADISAGVAEMAKRLNVPVLALVQLNRGVESRDDKRPMLSDLRQAGELEEDARQVLFLYRPEYYLREPTDSEGFEAKTKRLEELRAVENQLYWLVEKNSHGPRGQVKTFCEIGCSAIRDWEVYR